MAPTLKLHRDNYNISIIITLGDRLAAGIVSIGELPSYNNGACFNKPDDTKTLPVPNVA